MLSLPEQNYATCKNIAEIEGIENTTQPFLRLAFCLYNTMCVKSLDIGLLVHSSFFEV